MNRPALEIGKRGSAATMTACAGGCRHKGSGTTRGDLGIKSATRRLTILGYPSGGVCESCARTWPQIWDAAFYGFPENESQRAA